MNQPRTHSTIKVQNGHEVGEMIIRKPIETTEELQDAFFLLGQFLGFTYKQIKDMFFDEFAD
jgi:hypothetical protein